MLRESAQTRESAQELIDLGADVIHYPMIKTQENTDQTAMITADYLADKQMVIFGSATAVDIAMNALFRNGADTRVLAGKTLVCVGPKTAERLQCVGLHADIIPDLFQQEGLIEALGDGIKDIRIWLPGAKDARPDLCRALEAAGAHVSAQEIYQSVYANPAPIPIQDGDLIVFTSSSTALYFLTKSAYAGQRIIAYCIGDITRKTVEKYAPPHIDIRQSDIATVESVLSQIRSDYE